MLLPEKNHYITHNSAAIEICSERQLYTVQCSEICVGDAFRSSVIDSLLAHTVSPL